VLFGFSTALMSAMLRSASVKRAALARSGEHFGLLGLQLERDRLADQRAAPSFSFAPGRSPERERC
jgi:hypothetical protein